MTGAEGFAASVSVLIVDDEAAVRGTMREILDRNGYDTTDAVDAIAALDLLHQRSFDLVLLDVNMPGLDGYELLARLRDLPGFSAPVIMVTGQGEAAGIAREATEGAVDHVAKPFGSRDLIDAVERCLSLSPEELASRREHLGRAGATFDTLVRLRNELQAEYTSGKERNKPYYG